MTEDPLVNALFTELATATDEVAVAAQRTGRQHKSRDEAIERHAVHHAVEHILDAVTVDREDEILEISALINAEVKRLWPDPEVKPSRKVLDIIYGLELAHSIVMAQPRPSRRIPPELLVPQWWVRLAFISAMAFAAGTIIWNIYQSRS